jgi:hypothetical protein
MIAAAETKTTGLRNNSTQGIRLSIRIGRPLPGKFDKFLDSSCPGGGREFGDPKSKNQTIKKIHENATIPLCRPSGRVRLANARCSPGEVRRSCPRRKSGDDRRSALHPTKGAGFHPRIAVHTETQVTKVTTMPTAKRIHASEPGPGSIPDFVRCQLPL